MLNLGNPVATTPSGNQSLIVSPLANNCYTSPPLGTCTSDHHCVSVTQPMQGSTNPVTRIIWRGDFETADDLLNAVNWEDLLSSDIDQMWAAWEEKFIMPCMK